jgi:trehalose synthase
VDNRTDETDEITEESRMEVVELGPQSIDAYVESVGDEAVAALRRLAAPLRGLRVLHVNATADGGGVAELLRSVAPLLRDLGLDATWQTFAAEPAFFSVTKAIHNALQGAPHTLTPDEQAMYIAWQHDNAARLQSEYDIVVVHDPQPLGLRQAAGARGARWIWRVHVDSSQPDPTVWRFLRPFLAGYQVVVFTMPQFVLPGIDAAQARIIALAIDPLSSKNLALPHAHALALIAELGLDPGRPLLAQVARLDPWKDPVGVIDAYRLVRQSVPGLQLALLGVIAARDDPEAIGMADLVRSHADGDPDIHIYVDPHQVGPREVAAVQQSAQVVFQKSLREGFGLSVAEALWKATPVVGGRAGGIPLQLQDGVGGFLVESVAEAAERARWLLERPPDARTIAVRGREHVRAQFLITRLLADELRLYADVMEQRLSGEIAAA